MQVALAMDEVANISVFGAVRASKSELGLRRRSYVDLIIPGGRIHEPLEFRATEASLNCVIATRHRIGDNSHHRVGASRPFESQAPSKT